MRGGRRPRKGKHGYCGINFLQSGFYVAYLQVNKKRIYGGSSKNPAEAARKYDELAIRVHGDKAITNRSLGLL